MRIWPERAGDPFADRMNAIPKYVVSRTLGAAELTWNTVRIPGDEALAHIRKLRETDGGDLVVMVSPPSYARSCARAWSTSSSS